MTLTAMTLTTLISTDELEPRLLDPRLVLLDARFSLDDEAWGTSVYDEAHIPGALRADLSDHLSGQVIDGVTGRRPFPEPDVFAGQLSAWGIDSWQPLESGSCCVGSVMRPSRCSTAG